MMVLYLFIFADLVLSCYSPSLREFEISMNITPNKMKYFVNVKCNLLNLCIVYREQSNALKLDIKAREIQSR